jgi:hypothetical protein
MKHYKSLTAKAIVFLLLGAFGPAAFAQCSEDQAFNKMMAFNLAWGEYQRQYSAMPMHKQGEEFPKFSSGAERSAALSAKLAEKKWNEVCAGYDALAKEYGFNVKAASKGMITMEELKKDGGRRGGECDVGEAAKNHMGLMEKFTDKLANGEVTRQEQAAFMREWEPIGRNMQFDPSKVCSDSRALAKKWGL